MDLPSILAALVILLAATAICVLLFQRLGFGSVLGFIVAGIIVGPHTPGPVATNYVGGLQNASELGVVLFLFIVGLEMRPEKLWAMRRLLFGLGLNQVVMTGAVLGGYFFLFVSMPWDTAIILGLGLALSSTAIVMTILTERGEVATEHGQASFAVLMSQDLAVVPIMALIPFLAHTASQHTTTLGWEKVLIALLGVAGVFAVGRYLLPTMLGWAAKQRNMEAFGILLFLAVIASAWAMDLTGVSMTLAAFLMGMLLSASDYRYQIEVIVEPFKGTLMGLFFIAVGMSIDVGALVTDGRELLVDVTVLLVLKLLVLLALALLFGLSLASAMRTGFYLSQAGEFAFVLFGAAKASGLLSSQDLTLASLVIAVSMILTPLMVKAGDRLASCVGKMPETRAVSFSKELDRHVVVVGFNEVGRLICLMLERAAVPHLVFDRDYALVSQSRRAGCEVHFGDMRSDVTQRAAMLGSANAVFVTTTDPVQAKSLSITLRRLYPDLPIYTRANTLADADELMAKGVEYANPVYILGTLAAGGRLLKNLGVPETDVDVLLKELQSDNFAAIRTVQDRYQV